MPIEIESRVTEGSPVSLYRLDAGALKGSAFLSWGRRSHASSSSLFVLGHVGLGNLLHDLDGNLLEMRLGLPRCIVRFGHAEWYPDARHTGDLLCGTGRLVSVSEGARLVGTVAGRLATVAHEASRIVLVGRIYTCGVVI